MLPPETETMPGLTSSGGPASAQEANDAKMKQGGPQSATGEYKSESRHLTRSSRFTPSIPRTHPGLQLRNGA